MRALLTVSILVPLLLLSACASTPARHVVRVLSYNIHHGEGSDGVIDLQRIARVILDQDPDIVALQEVDVRTERASGVDQAEVLARLTGMEKAFVAAMRYQGGLYGEAVLSRLPILDIAVHRLPNPLGGEPRVILDVELRLGDGLSSITVLATHLDHEFPGNRAAATEYIDRYLVAEEPGPTLLIGDLNSTPDSVPMQKLWRRWRDASARDPAPTYPALAPDRKLDYVLYLPEERWQVIDCQVIEEVQASDHRPLLVTIRLRDP